MNNSVYKNAFTYGPSGRAKVEHYKGDTLKYKKLYVGNSEFIVGADGFVKIKRTFITAPTGICAVYQDSSETKTMHYVHTDNLGSWLAITDSTGRVENRYSYDAWGRPRNPSTWELLPVDTASALVSLNAMQPRFDRGYTWHSLSRLGGKHMCGFGLINMNGRLYDPYLQRFLSPDPYIQDATDAQNFNRYTYCLNNPLMYTDPSGWQYYQPGEYICPEYYVFFGRGTSAGRKGNGSGVLAPGMGDNGTGLNGVYYDWFSHQYVSTDDGSTVSWDYVRKNIVEPIGTNYYGKDAKTVYNLITDSKTIGVSIDDKNGLHIYQKVPYVSQENYNTGCAAAILAMLHNFYYGTYYTVKDAIDKILGGNQGPYSIDDVLSKVGNQTPFLYNPKKVLNYLNQGIPVVIAFRNENNLLHYSIIVDVKEYDDNSTTFILNNPDPRKGANWIQKFSNSPNYLMFIAHKIDFYP